MKQYKLVDNIFGWVAFIIAAFTYCFLAASGFSL